MESGARAWKQDGGQGCGKGAYRRMIDEEAASRNRRICKRCLTRDMAGQEEYFRSLHDYIENMDPDIKAPEQVYETRLSVCRECDLLFQGMCKSCGCYVELRAAVGTNGCPWKKW